MEKNGRKELITAENYLLYNAKFAFRHSTSY